MDEKIRKLEIIVDELWQGKCVDIEKLVDIINDITTTLMIGVERFRTLGVDFPVEFIKSALVKTQTYIKSKDEYGLADVLKYEWIEILQVYQEVDEQLE